MRMTSETICRSDVTSYFTLRRVKLAWGWDPLVLQRSKQKQKQKQAEVESGLGSLPSQLV